MSTLEDVISATNYIEHTLGLIFIARHGGAGRLWIDRRLCVPGEAERELKRLHIPISGRMVHGTEMGFLVSHKQTAWGAYVLDRWLSGNPVSAWDERPRNWQRDRTPRQVRLG